MPGLRSRRRPCLSAAPCSRLCSRRHLRSGIRSSSSAISRGPARARPPICGRCRSGLPQRWPRRFAGPPDCRSAPQLLLCAAPAAAAAAGLTHRLAADVALFHLSAAAALIVAGTVWLGLRRGPFDPRIAGYAVLGLLLVSLLPVEWGVLRSRVFDGAAGADGIGTFAIALFGLGAVFLMCASTLAPSRVQSYAACAIALGSAGLPVLFLLLYPSRFTLPSGELFTYPATASLSIAIGVLAAWAWWDIGRRLMLARPLAGADPAAVLSPVAFFALVVALRYGQTITPSVPSDDFHFGERLLGWWTTL